MSLTVSTTPAKTIGSYSSLWTAAHNPVVFKLLSDLFPVETVPVDFDYVSVSESASGNAVLVWSTNPDLAPVDLAPGRFVKVAGTVYSGEFEIVRYNPSGNALEIDLAFISTDSGTVARAFRNYVVNLKVFAGLPSAHKWQSLKPEAEIEILQQIPGTTGVAVFDIQEAVKQKVSTENNFSLASLPNDVNLWTGFRVSHEETYDTSTGAEGSAAGITAAGDSSGSQEFTVDTDLDLVAGDYVVLDNFTTDDYNGAVAKVISDDGTDIVLDIDYNGSLTLNGYETAQKFNIAIVSFESGYTEEGSQYYATNAKLPPRSTYGGNLGEYLLTNTSGLNIPFLSGYSDKKSFEGKRDEVFLLVDKTFTDAISSEFILEVAEKDQNKTLLTSSGFKVPNEEEGVYRIDYLGDFLVQFISVWNTVTTSTGSSLSDEITLPLIASGTYDFVVDWGDGVEERITTWNQSEVTHKYTTSGTKEIKISGTIQGWQFNNTGDKEKILSISNWGSLDITTEGGFYGCSNLSLAAVEGVLTFSGNNAKSLFRNCSSLTTIGNIANWDMSNVTTFQDIFYACSLFNDGNINSWDTSSVLTLRASFRECSIFNQSLDNWDVSNCSNFDTAFFSCLLLNQSFGSWDVSIMTVGTLFLSNTNLSTANYDATLISWDALTVKSGVTLGVTGLTYTAAGAGGTARASLITNDSWTFVGDSGV